MSRRLAALGIVLAMTTFAVVLVLMLTMLESVVQAETTEREPETGPTVCEPGRWSIYRLDGECRRLNPSHFGPDWADVRHESVRVALVSVLRGDAMLPDALTTAILRAACNYANGRFSEADRTCLLVPPKPPAPTTTTTTAPAWPPPMCGIEANGNLGPPSAGRDTVCSYPIARPSAGIRSMLTASECVTPINHVVNGHPGWTFQLWAGDTFLCVRVPTMDDFQLPANTICGPHGTAVWHSGRLYNCR